MIIGWDFLQSNGGTVNDLLGFTPLTEEQQHCSYDVVVSVSVTNIVDTVAIAVESLVTVLVKDAVKMPPTELLCGYQN